jgi:hypothetical protein
MKELQERLRQNTIDVLEFISSREDQLKLQQAAPFVNVPAEVLCKWADDTYGFAEHENFRNAFTTAELSRNGNL